MSINVKSIILLLALWTVYSACIKDAPTGSDNGFEKIAGEKVLIINEGNFGTGNATIDVYNVDIDSMQVNVYQAINRDAIGDVLQDAVVYEDKIFLIVNNSNKVIIIDRFTLRKIDEIAIVSPRKVLPINNGKCYISSLNSNKIWVYNPTIRAIVDSIEMPYQNVEDMVLYQQKVLAAPWDTACQRIYIIDPMEDTISSSLSVNGAAPKHIVPTRDNVWIYYGNVWKGKPSGISVINTNTTAILKQREYDGMTEMIKPTLNNDSSKMYWLGVDYNINGSVYNGVMVMDVTSNGFPNAAIIPPPALNYFYGIKIMKDNSIWVSNPNSFLSGSTIGIYNSNHELRKQLQSGIGTNSFLLWD